MYVFNHIPKTAGMSMYRLLQQLVGADRVSPHFTLNEEVSYQLSAADYERYLIIYGHFGVVWNDLIGPRRKWMTVLRDPVDRVLSQYYYWRSLAPMPDFPHVNAAQTLELPEFVRSRHYMLQQANENGQTWFLGDDFRVPYRKVSQKDILNVAKQHLVERFAFIGFTEDLPGSARRLCQLLQVPPPSSIPTENRTPVRKAFQEIDPGVIGVIKELTQMDQALYDFGKELVRQSEMERERDMSPLICKEQSTLRRWDF